MDEISVAGGAEVLRDSLVPSVGEEAVRCEGLELGSGLQRSMTLEVKALRKTFDNRIFTRIGW